MRRSGSSGGTFRFEKRRGTEDGKLGLDEAWEEAELAETKRVELKRVDVVHPGAKLEAALKEVLGKRGRCASLVDGMPGTKGRLQEGQKWSNWTGWTAGE